MVTGYCRAYFFSKNPYPFLRTKNNRLLSTRLEPVPYSKTKAILFLMKKLLFVCFFVFFYPEMVSAQSHRAAIRNGHGATNPQEIGQAVFSALQQNQFGNVQQYLPDEIELRILTRRSSEDMRALLQILTPDSIKRNLQKEFNQISEESTANAFNWQDWQPADTKLQQRDPKNRLLYRAQVTLANVAGAEKYLLFEAIKIRNRYFLFRQIDFRDKI
jgi:hypothetical protein